MSEESFTLEEQRVIAAARDLAALDEAERFAFKMPGVPHEHHNKLFEMRQKAERILEQSVAALLASEREAP